jgi:altronate dehydratase small subunit
MMNNLDGFEKRSFRVNIADNVATMLCAAEPGDTVLVQGGAAAQHLEILEDVLWGHKVALAEIAKGAFVVKSGVRIGIATQSVKPGEWVHLHNCRSQVDERSSHLDQFSGAAQDTAYA